MNTVSIYRNNDSQIAKSIMNYMVQNVTDKFHPVIGKNKSL